MALSDCGIYAQWLFDNPDRANGPDLEVAISHISYNELAAAFTKVTRRPAQFIDVPFSKYFENFESLGAMASVMKIPNMSLWTKLRFGLQFSTQRPSSCNADPTDPSVMPFERNFTGFWHIWRESQGNKGVITRNYKLLELLDEFTPIELRPRKKVSERSRKGRFVREYRIWLQSLNGAKTVLPVVCNLFSTVHVVIIFIAHSLCSKTIFTIQ